MTFKVGQWCVRCTREGHQSYECKQPLPPPDPKPIIPNPNPNPKPIDPYDAWTDGCFMEP